MTLLQRLIFLTAAVLILLTTACDVETEFLTGDDVQLRFSVDTLAFDTVFVARGSATQRMKVYNDNEQPIKIDRVSVEGQTGVNFIFNIDGTGGP